MFKLEKVFQNDDSGYILFINFIKSIFILITIYLYSILNENTIYDLNNFDIYKNSNFFLYSIFLPLFFFLNISFYKNKSKYQKKLISFIKEDFINLIFSNLLTIIFINLFTIKINIDLNFFYIFIFCNITLFVLKLYFNYLYQSLVKKNIIQKNVMLVGTYQEIKKILLEKFEKILIFKCCLITDLGSHNLKIIKSEIKIPVFNKNEDIRSILEYHSLGQIWMLNGNEKKKEDIFSNILRYSVDTLNVNLSTSKIKKEGDLLAKKFDYEYYELSRFHGVPLFIKILIDKFFSIIFLTFSLPILIFFSLAIYLEDGLPILFTQNRTGWDGRRFKIFKLRSLFNKKYDPINQVTKDDNRKLKVGKIIRKFSIDEIPQFYNVFKGEMSLVGPRPHPITLDLKYMNLYNSFLTRYRCNPGLTGWSQIHGLRGATSDPEDMKKRMEYDLWYLKNWSIFLDFYIILKTFYAIFKFKGD
mgnify:FL=1